MKYVKLLRNVPQLLFLALGVLLHQLASADSGKHVLNMQIGGGVAALVRTDSLEIIPFPIYHFSIGLPIYRIDFGLEINTVAIYNEAFVFTKFNLYPRSSSINFGVIAHYGGYGVIFYSAYGGIIYGAGIEARFKKLAIKSYCDVELKDSSDDFYSNGLPEWRPKIILSYVF